MAMASIKHYHFLLLVAAAVILLDTGAASRVALTSLVNTTSSATTMTAAASADGGAVTTRLTNSTTTATAATVYDVLAKYGFPPGILPEGVQSYTINPDDGSFQVSLPGDCVVEIDGYKIRYRSQIYGDVRNGSIGNLDGVSVKVAIVWVGIHDVDVDGGSISFHAGAISKSCPVGDLSTSPRC